MFSNPVLLASKFSVFFNAYQERERGFLPTPENTLLVVGGGSMLATKEDKSVGRGLFPGKGILSRFEGSDFIPTVCCLMVLSPPSPVLKQSLLSIPYITCIF